MLLDIPIFDTTDFGLALSQQRIPNPDNLESLYVSTIGEPLDVIQQFANHEVYPISNEHK